MPYSIAKGKGCSPSKPWAVVKDTDGTVVACHATRETALAQIRALYASEPALAKARARVLKHPGHADQKVHGRGKSTAVESYVKDSNKINSALRRGETPTEVADIDAEMASSSLPEMTVHRAIEFSPSDRAMLPWGRLESAGDTVSDLGFTSTSKDKTAIDDFTPMGFSDRFVMSIRVPAGTKGLDLGGKYGLSTGMGDQGEVLLDRGAKFKLLKEPRFTPDGTTYLDLEVVSTNQTVAKHLPHQHDQSTHGNGGGVGDTPKPERKKRSKADIASDDEKALALYESGKTWDQVAQEMGYANGGVARRSGLRHKEKRDAQPADKKPVEPDTPKPVVEPVKPAPEPSKPVVPEPVTVVNPRPMTAVDSSQGNIPTDDIDVAKATGRPYSRLKPDTAHSDVREAEEKVIGDMQKVVEASQAMDPYSKPLMDAERQRLESVNARVKERAQKIRREGEEEWRAEHRAVDELKAEGQDADRYGKSETEILQDGVRSGQIPADVYENYTRSIDQRNRSIDSLQQQIAIDTADIVLANGKGERVSLPIEQAGWRDDGTHGVVSSTTPALILPDGRALVYPHRSTKPSTYERSKDGSWVRSYREPSVDELDLISEVSQRRARVYEARRVRQRREFDPDERIVGVDHRQHVEDSLAFQQSIVDSPHTRIVIHAPVSAVGGIMTQGRFRSQHETGRTKGYKDPGHVREGFEAAALGVAPNGDPTKAPIYGALHVGGVRAPEAIGAEQYGPVGFVLKRDTHSRSTFTQTDSLAICYETSPLTGRQTTLNNFSTAGGLLSAMTGGGESSRPLTLDEHRERLLPTGQRKRYDYMEAQVLGGVSVADIDYITIPKGTVLPAATRKKIDKAGIRVVEYDIADVAPKIVGTEKIYPERGDIYEVPKFADTPDWTPIPEPTTKWHSFVADIWKHLNGKHDQASHAGARHGGYRLTTPDNPKASAGSQSAEAIASAKALRDRVASIEPDLTRSMIDLADKHGGKMEGLAHRLKSEQSLARKIDAEKDDFGGDTDKTAEAMSDVVRYTVTFKDSNYVSGATQTIADLQASGHKTRVKNYWKEGDPYQGVNVAVTTPAGLTFELQFHTPRSLAVKELNHKAYEKYRTATNARDRYRYWDEGIRIASRVPVPSGDILGFGDIKTQEFALKAHSLEQVVRSLFDEVERLKEKVS